MRIVGAEAGDDAPSAYVDKDKKIVENILPR